MQAWLHVTHQRANLTRIPLLSVTVVGRSADCHLKIATTQVSRRHCQISLHADGVYVEDLASANGTFLDGIRLTPGVPTFVSPGGKLNIGPARFIVDYTLPSPRHGVTRDADETIDHPPKASSDDDGLEYLRQLVSLPGVHQPSIIPQFSLETEFTRGVEVNFLPPETVSTVSNVAGQTESAYRSRAVSPTVAGWLPAWWKEKQASAASVSPR